MSTPDRVHEKPGAPPWLWFWALLFLANLPLLGAQWRASYDSLVELRASTARLQAMDPSFGRLSFLLYPSALVDLLPSLALLLGLASVLLPRLRAAYVERIFRLTSPPNLATMAEIQRFVDLHAPRLAIKANLLRAGQLAFVYPAGYRQARLAVFGGLLRLWRADREAAEAVLLHEIAHYRRGDVLILGTGSFFQALVTHGMLLSFVLFVLPLAVVLGAQALSAHGELRAMGASAAEAGNHLLYTLVARDLPGILLIALTLLLRVALFLVLPMAAIWSAELNADHLAAAQLGSGMPVRRALGGSQGRETWWRWLLLHLSHPPARLRTWLLQCSERDALVWLLLVFPLGYLVRLLVLYAWSGTLSFQMGLPPATIAQNLVSNTLTHLEALRPVCLGMALLLAAWPLLLRYWEGAFAAVWPTPDRSAYQTYGFAALLAAAAALGTYL